VKQRIWSLGASAFVSSWLLGGVATLATAQQEPPPPQQPEGAQILTQGPIHEAFAEPLISDPKPGPVAPKAPPAVIKELPPEQKPEGANVQWIPGYWSWDDSRNDYIWVSGVWRAVPPARQWVPGYWNKVDGGYQWVPGYWASTEATQTHYLPEPPASLDNGPTSEAPQPDATWSPGTWVWQDDQYAWQPGFWVNNQPGWMWNPSFFSWTPNGYIYNRGFWDYPLANRGLAFAPTYFSQPIYGQPNFAYTPTTALVSSALLGSLFVRPSYGSYYFGDYYAPNYFRSGIYPWYSFHGSRYGYDPLYSYMYAQNRRTNPRWGDELYDTYRYRRDHPEARPARTFAESRRIVARPSVATNVPPGAAQMELARPLHQFTTPAPGAIAGANSKAEANAMRFERLDQARRDELAGQAAQIHRFAEARSRREAEAWQAAQPKQRSVARPLESPRSPILAAPRSEGPRMTPPSMPTHPTLDRAIRPNATGAPITRPEPSFEPGRAPAPPPPATRPPAEGAKRKS
jgi:hypothetical protein